MGEIFILQGEHIAKLSTGARSALDRKVSKPVVKKSVKVKNHKRSILRHSWIGNSPSNWPSSSLTLNCWLLIDMPISYDSLRRKNVESTS